MVLGWVSSCVVACCCVGVAGKYYSLMQSLPTVAPTAFHGLTRLFDIYFYTVATSFVPQTSLHAVFAHFESLEGGAAASPQSEDADAFPLKDPVGTACRCGEGEPSRAR